MNNLLQFHIHSFVDLITNSSSELFLCDSKKTLAAFKSVILALVQKNPETSSISMDELFQSIFKEPTICQITFDINTYPKKKEFLSIHNWDLYRDHPVYIRAKSLANSTTDPKVANQHYKPWMDLQHQTKTELYQWVYAKNKLKWTFGDNLLDPKDIKIWQKFWQETGLLSLAVSYGFTLKKGAILLQSAEDNSVPYELMDLLESKLPCNRYHIG